MTDVRINVPPQLIESARAAQYANRSRVSNKELQAKTKKKVEVEAKKQQEKQNPLSEERLGGQLEFRKKNNPKIWTKCKCGTEPAFMFSEIVLETDEGFEFTFPQFLLSDDTIYLSPRTREVYYSSDQVDQAGKEAELFKSYPLISEDSIDVFVNGQGFGYIKTRPSTVILDTKKIEGEPEDSSWRILESSDKTNLLYYKLELKYVMPESSIERTQEDNYINDLALQVKSLSDNGWTVTPGGKESIKINGSASLRQPIYSATCFLGDDSRGKYMRIYSGNFLIQAYGGKLVEQTDNYRTYSVEDKMITIYATEKPSIVGAWPLSSGNLAVYSSPNSSVNPETLVTSQETRYVYAIEVVTTQGSSETFYYDTGYESLRVEKYGQVLVTWTRQLSQVHSQTDTDVFRDDSGNIVKTITVTRFTFEETSATQDVKLVGAATFSSSYTNIKDVYSEVSGSFLNTSPPYYPSSYSWSTFLKRSETSPMPMTATAISPRINYKQTAEIVFGSSIESLPQDTSSFQK